MSVEKPGEKGRRNVGNKEKRRIERERKRRLRNINMQIMSQFILREITSEDSSRLGLYNLFTGI
jgi:hypothetical protein